MRAFRVSASILALIGLGFLAACGGGGGGGGSTLPGGGGGGSTSTPTPKPSSSSSTAPTPTPSPTSAPSSGSVQVSTYVEQAEEGPQVNPPPPANTQGWYTAGVTVSWTPNPGTVGQNGDTSAGANASNSFPSMDGMSCTPTVEPASSPNTYSEHAFVGIFVNGTQETLPQAIGMENPTAPTADTPNAPSGHPNDNYEVEQWQCEYNLHTHDYSGLVHIEDVNYPQSTSTTSPLPYSPTLKSLLDIWGVQLGPNSLTIPGQATINGTVNVYFGNQGTDLGPHNAPLTDAYQKASSGTNGSDVGLAYHTTVWIVIGNMPTQPTGDVGLPKVEWRVQN